jgi:hypothetical protein
MCLGGSSYLLPCYMHPMMRSAASLRLRMSLLVGVAAGCGDVGGHQVEDAPPPPSDGEAAVGSELNPARTCAALKTAGMPSGSYWLRNAAGQAPYPVYCEQDLNGGGWALLENSVRRDDGTTTTFWQFSYDDRLSRLGTPAPDQNYYDGALYLHGAEYLDLFVDLSGKAAVAAIVTVEGFNPTTMRFTNPKLTIGNTSVFNSQFAGGWSSYDHDDDLHNPADGTEPNCARVYGHVAQHYAACWIYNLGADADADRLDGGVGPHVHNMLLTQLGLAAQPAVGNYSQVSRIARFARW